MTLLDRAYLLFTGQASADDQRLAMIFAALLALTAALLVLIHLAERHPRD